MSTPNDSTVQDKELLTENITEYVKGRNSEASNPRLKFLLDKLIDYLHGYVRETRLTNEEWMSAIEFLTKCGQTCTNVRQEFILLSDVLGVSVLVDEINHPKPPNATESTVLGPFYTDDAENVANGESIASPGKGETCLVLATVKDTKGQPIEGVHVNVWETDGEGRYDNQYEVRDKPDMRGCLTSDKTGEVYFKCVKPVSYGVPTDGPVGELLEKFHRHAYRPAHIHFRLTAPESDYDELVTALYIRGDPYLTSDIVCGVKNSLIVDAVKVEDASLAKKYGVDEQDWLVRYDFVLTTRVETEALLQASTQA